MSAAAIIEELLEYFEDRADASMEPGEDRFHGNKEMSLLQEVQKLEKYISEETILRERAQGGLRIIRAMATLAKAQRNGVSAPDLKAICDAGLSLERTVLYSQVSDPKDFTANGGVLESQK